MYILLSISALLLFGFMGLSIYKFGIQNCYSAYGRLWGALIPQINIWSMITIVSALLMTPVLLELAAFTPWAFLGFLAPVSLIMVGISPDYKESKFSNVIHQIGAWGSIVFILLYLLLVPKLLWIIIPFLLAAVVLAFVFRPADTITLWAEIAMYLATYIAIFMMI